MSSSRRRSGGRVRAVLWLLVVLAVVGPDLGRCQASPEKRGAVLEAIETLFEAMKECDPERAGEVLDPDGRFYRVALQTAGSEMSSFDGEEFISGLADCSRERVERMGNPRVEVRQTMAMVWAPYDFWLDGKFSHCGVNLFNLVEIDGRWKILGGVYTFETAGCEEASSEPPGLPASD